MSKEERIRKELEGIRETTYENFLEEASTIIMQSIGTYCYPYHLRDAIKEQENQEIMVDQCMDYIIECWDLN